MSLPTGHRQKSRFAMSRRFAWIPYPGEVCLARYVEQKVIDACFEPDREQTISSIDPVLSVSTQNTRKIWRTQDDRTH